MAYLPDHLLRRARDQHSILTRRELVAMGVTRGRISGWVSRGYLVPVHRGVYRIGGAATTPMQDHYAALRRAPAGSVLGGRSALAMLKADGFDLDSRPFVVLPGEHALTNVRFDWISADIETRDRAFVSRIPISRPARALVEVAEHADPRRVRGAFDDLRRRDLVTRNEVLAKASAYVGRLPGAEAMLAMARNGTLILESEGERRLQAVFRPSDPQPIWQVWVLSDVRVDALFPEARLALEYQGRQYHTISEDRQQDEARIARIANEEEIETMEVRHADLHDPAALRQRILGRRAERIAAGVEPLRTYRLISE